MVEFRLVTFEAPGEPPRAGILLQGRTIAIERVRGALQRRAGRCR